MRHLLSSAIAQCLVQVGKGCEQLSLPICYSTISESNSYFKKSLYYTHLGEHIFHHITIPNVFRPIKQLPDPLISKAQYHFTGTVVIGEVGYLSAKSNSRISYTPESFVL